MLIIPAIDIKDGKCVRLVKGDFNQVTTYSKDPLAMAKVLEKQGAQMVHIVDLDGAKSGSPKNKKAIIEIVKTIKTPMQVGGGIRTYEAAKDYLQNGVERVLLGTVTAADPKLVMRLITEFGYGRITVACDFKNGRFATNGWVDSSGMSVVETITYLQKIGVKNVLVTDVSRDGMLAGPNFKLTQMFIDAGLQTIASGGVSSVDDCNELNRRGAYGAVVGKAYYEGALNIREAQEMVSLRSNLTKRIIACLDVKAGQVVKGTNFTSLRNVGDPITLAKKYVESGADELIFLDISASVEGRKTLKKLVKNIAKGIDIPFCVGGGINSLDDVRELLVAGADKVSIGSAAISRPDLVKKAAQYFGSQCIVVSVDAQKQDDSWQVYIKSGSEATGVDAVNFCQQMEAEGAGEILVNSLDRDGMNSGFDLELLETISKRVNIPVIASSGGGSKQDFLDVFEKTDVEAALGASIFHLQNVKPIELKTFLSEKGIRVRI